MKRAHHIAVAALLLSGVAHGANSPDPLDLPPSNVLPAPVEITPSAPAGQQPAELPPADPSGNPLWAIPLSSLTATRERPLFLPSRRAPAAAITGPVAVAPMAPPPPPPAEPERPPLTLIGVIAGDNEGFAVFLDQATNNVVRLKTGQDHDGWVLRAVKGREATLHKNGKSEILALPLPGGGAVLGRGEQRPAASRRRAGLLAPRRQRPARSRAAARRRTRRSAPPPRTRAIRRHRFIRSLTPCRNIS